jgi:hypothetical protein
MLAGAQSNNIYLSNILFNRTLCLTQTLINLKNKGVNI